LEAAGVMKAAKQVFPNMRKHAKPEPKLISAPENAAAQPALVFELKPAQTVMPAEQEAENSADGGVVIEGSCIDEGGPRPVTSTPIANEQPALFAANESQPATPAASVISGKPAVEGGELAAGAGLVLKGSHIGESGPAPVLSHPIMVEQPAMVAENQLKPASPNETAISAKPEVQTFTTKAGVVLQGAPIEEGVPAPVSSALSEKVHFGLLHGIDVFLAEQPPFCLEELQAFSALCNDIFRSNASNNQTRPPGAGTA
jgi:hypothetical protein